MIFKFFRMMDEGDRKGEDRSEDVYVPTFEDEQYESLSLVELAKMVEQIPTYIPKAAVRDFMVRMIERYLCDKLVSEDQWNEFTKNATVIENSDGTKAVIVNDEGKWYCEKVEGFWKCYKW